MPAILRIDVDRAYENRILHYARVNQELFLGKDLLGYLKSCKDVIEDLNSRGIKASLFFQPFTVPNKEFAQELVKEGHSIGLHKFKSAFNPELVPYYSVKLANQKGKITEKVYLWVKKKGLV